MIEAVAKARFEEWATRFSARVARMYGRRLVERLRTDDSVPDDLRSDPAQALHRVFLDLPTELRSDTRRLRAAFLWAVERYVSGGIHRMEDLLGPDSRTCRALAFWAKRTNRIYPGLPDRLDGFPDLPSLEEVTTARDRAQTRFEPRILRKAASDPAVSAGTRVLRDDAEALVVEVTSWPAARFWGSGTSWCTVPNAELCSRYLGRGPLYVLVDKNTGRKYQLHVETGQFMDERDRFAGIPELRRLFPGAMERMEPEHRAMLVYRAWCTGSGVDPSDFLFVLDGPMENDWLPGILLTLLTNEHDDTIRWMASGITDTSMVERIGSRLPARYREFAAGVFGRLLPHVREDLRAPLLSAVRTHILEPVQHDGYTTVEHLGGACISFLENSRDDALRTECLLVLVRLLRKSDNPWYILEMLAKSRIGDADLRRLVSSSAPRKIASVLANALEEGGSHREQVLRRLLPAGIFPEPVRQVHHSCLWFLDADANVKILQGARRSAPSLFRALSLTVFFELTGKYRPHPEIGAVCRGTLARVDRKTLDAMAAVISRKTRKTVTADDLRELAGP